MLKIERGVDLKNYSSMKVGGKASYFVEVKSVDELKEALSWSKKEKSSFRVIGGGYNILFTDHGFNGLVIVNKISGFEVIEENETSTTIKVGAGEDWDKIVEKTVKMNLSGIEALSLIPSSVGASPIQNIGAYGQEISSSLVSVSVVSADNGDTYEIENEACDFGYRTSRFKGLKNQVEVITHVTLRLSKNSTLKRPLYKDLESYFEENKMDEPTPSNVRKAVVATRQAKLPDPEKVPNTGSFYGNPVITSEKYEEIIEKWPELGNWHSKIFNKKSQGFWKLPSGKYKVAAGMLIEHAGLANVEDKNTGMGTWKYQGLVLINNNAKSSKDLFAFSDHIIETVRERYDITLELEPEVIEA